MVFNKLIEFLSPRIAAPTTPRGMCAHRRHPVFALQVMGSRLPALTGLRAFEASARLGSHRKAGVELHLDHTVVGKHVRKLESELGVQLLEKTPTGTRPTPEGEIYLRDIAHALQIIGAATEKLRAPDTQPTLHIACSPGIGMRWLAPRISTFLEANPGLEITLRPTSRAPDLPGGEADVDIRSANAGTSLITKHLELSRPRMYPVASPAFLASHPPIKNLEDLLTLPLCHEETHEYWRLWLKAAGLELEQTPTGPRYWSAALAVEAARLGHGIAIANDFIAADEVASGRLVEVLTSAVTVFPYLFTALRARWNDPVVARFRNWLVGQMVPQAAQ
ncbi:MAG: LysR substrate-binding domain-containing protein [Gammaproteobacteria bacterium]